MKKIFGLILIVLVFGGVFNLALAEEKPVKLHYFYASTCPNCKKAGVFLDKLENKYPGLEISRYEILSSRENAELLLKFFEVCGEEKIIRVPAIFVGSEAIIGYLNDAATGKKIEGLVEECLIKECPDPLEKVDHQCQTDKNDEIIDYPIIGKINLSRLSLPILTIATAALDGFNPCAMWVLLFLLALLINVCSKKRMLLIGGTFIAASGIVYFLIMSAWLNLFLAIGYVNITRITIGVLAGGVGIWQIRKFITYRPGVCEVAPAGSKWHERLSRKAKQAVESTTLSAALVGVIALAFGVNLIEFFCSAGLPAIYTKILSLSHLNDWGYYLYLLLYTFVFMLDDLIIFAVAVITLSKLGFTDKYSKWATLIGGLVILILGVLLIFKPEFLMFG